MNKPKTAKQLAAILKQTKDPQKKAILFHSLLTASDCPQNVLSLLRK